MSTTSERARAGYIAPRDWRDSWTRFSDSEQTKSDWITVAPAHFYPDYLEHAVARYEAAIVRFAHLANTAASSEALLRGILRDPTPAFRRPMTRIFRRYVCPTAPVELTKRIDSIETTILNFGAQFRNIEDVRSALATRPIKDEALSAILWEHQERGKRGSDLTSQFFEWVQHNLPSVIVSGGRDISLPTIFRDYPTKRGVDFTIVEGAGVLAVGYLHYDSDRGGSQEGDRTGGYNDAAEEIGEYLNRQGARAKIIFINDGPGLLAGAMWRKYAALEERWPKRILVATLKMLRTRLSVEWLRS